MGRPRVSHQVGFFSSASTRTGRSGVDRSRAISTTSASVRIPSRPSYAVFIGRTSVIRSVAPSVRSSASVKSSVNQPVRRVDPKSRVVRRSANSGRPATSVVRDSSLSCRTTSAPSLLSTTSGSIRSAPWSMASP